MDKEELRNKLREAEENDPALASMRLETAFFAASSLQRFGELLEVSGHLIGSDRKEGNSPFGFGSDEVYGVSLLLRIGAQLTKNCTELFRDGHPYSAAALLRQIVEVEYVSWAFENRHNDAETWLRSDGQTRQELFRPANLRAAASGRFRTNDYSYHCEFGGHPTPKAMSLLSNDTLLVQLLMSDLIGHTHGIWGHFVGWGKKRTELEPLFGEYQGLGVETESMFEKWRSADPLVGLRPPH